MNNSSIMAKSLIWKLLERFGVLGGQFVLQIILARLLAPDHYGILSLMVIFTSFANVFIQHGFNTALVQNKDVTDEDYSSIFWVNLGITTVMYIAFFLAAPVIAFFYKMPDIVWPFRVLCLMLFPGALNSVQLARSRKRMDFKSVFQCNIMGILISGVVGIVLAYFQAGLWALVIQNVLNTTVSCVVMWFTVDFRPKFCFNLNRVKVLFSFGWKLVVSNLLDTLYQDIRSLVIGLKYSAGVFGFYDRGKQFPQFLNSAINSTVQSVLLPAMSAEQDDQEKVKELTRNSVMLCSYIVLPMMAGLAAVAEPLVRFLLTDKWLPCVPYLQLYCFTFAFYPVHTCNLQAINAMGRSDLFLKLEIIKKGYGIVVLAIAVFCFDSPVAIAATGLVTTWIGWFVNAFPNKKLIGYSYKEQFSDLVPSICIALIMCVGVFFVGHWCETMEIPDILIIALQVIIGIVVYLILSIASKSKPFYQLLALCENLLKSDKHSQQ